MSDPATRKALAQRSREASGSASATAERLFYFDDAYLRGQSSETKHRTRIMSGVTGPTLCHTGAGTGAELPVRATATDHLNDSLKPIAPFVDEVVRLARAGKPRRASDLAFDFFESRFSAGRFAESRAALRAFDRARFSGLTDTVLVALLAVTRPAKTNLRSARPGFVNRVRDYLTETNGPTEAELVAQMHG
jgi:hypothetical protein